MSQQAVSQLRSEQPVGGNSPETTPNGIETPAAGGGSTQNIPHFGTFNEEVRQGVQSLQEGLAIAEDAASELKKIFKKNEKIVSAVAKRWEDDQALHEEIRKLRAANEGIWEHINRDREKYATTISRLKQEHSEEVSGLEVRATAGDREKQRYEESKRKMENKYQEDKENGDAAFVRSLRGGLLCFLCCQSHRLGSCKKPKGEPASRSPPFRSPFGSAGRLDAGGPNMIHRITEPLPRSSAEPIRIRGLWSWYGTQLCRRPTQTKCGPCRPRHSCRDAIWCRAGAR